MVNFWSLKRFLVAILIFMGIFGNTAFGDCDWSKLVHNADGSVTYPKEVHICVGQMHQDLDSANLQIADYKKAIDLKDLALKTSDDRANMWMDTSLKLEKELQEVDSLRSKNEKLYFGIGVATTVLAVWAAGQLRTH